MQKKMNTLKSNFTKHSKTIADEVPLIGSAFKMATNPIALTPASILAVGKGIDYTTQKAADFNTQFRTLANLNHGILSFYYSVTFGCIIYDVDKIHRSFSLIFILG